MCLFATAVHANDLTVDKRTVRLTETVSIVVSLEDEYAGTDFLNLPLQNLELVGRPAVSRTFTWINGQTVTRKVFRYTARPVRAGAALVGPLTIDGSGGRRETLAPVSVQVLPDAAAGTNDPIRIARELIATGRELFFVIAEVDRPQAFVGEQVIVTWVMYNGTNVQGWQIGRVPKLEEFWSEEIDVRNEPPGQEVIADRVLQRIPVRRVALFPLRSGTLTIGGMEIEASVLRRIDTRRWGGQLYEGAMEEVAFNSANLTVDVRPLPAGPPVDVIGDVELQCGAPSQRAGGPVTVNVMLSGRGNLRGTAAPRWSGAVAGDVQVELGKLSIDRARGGVTMSRRWQYLIFPGQGGTLTLPPLRLAAFSPARGERQELRCEAVTLDVIAASMPGATGARAKSASARRLGPWIAFAAIVLALALVLLPRLRRAARLRARVRELTRDRAPREIRIALDELIVRRGSNPATLMYEASERGDAYRAIVSLLDAAERDRVVAEDADREIEVRARDLLQSLAR